MVSFTVTVKGKKPVEVQVDGKTAATATVLDIKRAVQARYPTYVFNRQRLTYGVSSTVKPIPLVDEAKTLGSYGVPDGATLRMKDLGRQVGYKYLYLWEYPGPIFLVPLWYRYSDLLWGEYERSSLQTAIQWILVLHFSKRWLESYFLHTFSRATLPLSYVFRNSLYYWGVCGLLIPLTFFRPQNGEAGLTGKWAFMNSEEWIWFWSSFILINEVLNFNAHIHLASLRQPKGQPRKYPTGFGFGSIVCANYFFESLAVLPLIIMTLGDFGTIVYNFIAIYFMQRWGGQKYARYKKEFNSKEYPGKRWIFFPGVY